MTDMGSIAPGVPANLLGAAGAGAAAAAGEAGCADLAGAVLAFSTKARMSSLVTRPPEPVPEIEQLRKEK